MRRQDAGGFTLVELLVTVAIIGILSTIAVMSYLSAITRARQKRTVSDMRMVAMAWEARATDVQSYLVAGAGFTFPAGAIDPETLIGALVPTYTRDFPQYDGWKRPFGFAAEETGTAKTYAIRSMGRDGIFESNYQEGLTTSPDCDIVFSNGSFVLYPSAVQEK
jgi:type II secretion system protein G